jgi:hypothetical protein
MNRKIGPRAMRVLRSVKDRMWREICNIRAIDPSFPVTATEANAEACQNASHADVHGIADEVRG